MTTILAYIRRHPVLSYYVLAFALSWGGVLLVIIAGGSSIPATPEQFQRLIPFMIPALYLGPATAGLLMPGLVDGRAGYGELLARLLRWRVGAGWYAVALLTAPLVFTATGLALALTSPVHLPAILTTSDRASLLLIGTLPALLVGLFEEVGWTGFAIPQLRRRYGVLSTGLIAGVLWGAWHILTNDIWGAGTVVGDLPLGLYLTLMGVSFLVGQLPAFRVLMVWVYDRTGSLLLAVLMHASLTASTWLLAAAGLTGALILINSFAITAGMWLAVAAVALATHGQFARQPLRRQAA
jgi:membrane protease YdiL (CAAX protease family)